MTISSAKDLKNINWHYGPTRPYDVDQRLVIPLPRPVNRDSTLYTNVVHAGNEEGTKKLIGSARLKLRDVLNDVGTRERVKRTLISRDLLVGLKEKLKLRLIS
ncbi:hypothetical protein Patl1_20252 [Pistacia atlantica]|uniref:Uncharacterized protein n=1 Tax=Pistacia atlantica TaxID=434234 RepID=A0ACC1BN34_9ROSI|nr:hypothetical protein Patl1_20252 [Pistacia atlantica]